MEKKQLQMIARLRMERENLILDITLLVCNQILTCLVERRTPCSLDQISVVFEANNFLKFRHTCSGKTPVGTNSIDTLSQMCK